MDFIMLLCKRPNAFVLATLVILIGFLSAAWAEDIGFVSADLREGESNSLIFKADYHVVLTPALVDALHRGVSLSFSLDLDVSEPRWYWLDRKVVNWHQERRLSYNPLTRTYRFSIGGIYLTFTNLEDALYALESIHSQSIALDSGLGKNGVYQAKLIFKLDTSQLPKPFQLDALYSTDWKLEAPAHEWIFHP